ncbi:MAG: CDP-glucose 4,6-dehydratase [Dysgonamonadaceae bacterium]|jgi:CDP-glucose 4,6-dehydratase|nr:CDP-glucose 4,6-dehydratase [Dysgonamonadaceae bacterium]
MVDFAVYSNKRVLITGHTGFKGSWLAIWLHALGAKVWGYALNPYSEKDNFVLSGIGEQIENDIRGDIRDRKKLHEVFTICQPEIVFHLAAQPLVRLSYEHPVETYETNVMGSVNVLEEVRQCSATKIAIMITTDKCYENREQWWGYRENEALGGYDPYSSSKGAAEIAISAWRRSFMNPLFYEKHGKALASVRAGNVVGGGDWAADRIVPDCIRAIEAGKPVEVRFPQAVRPWQHVLEPLSGYLTLGAKLWSNPTKFAEAWNFGPSLDSIVPVWDVARMVVEFYGAGMLKDASNPDALHEAKLLALDISKARYELGWTPKWNIRTTIAKTVEWYAHYQKENVYQLCLKQITEYNDHKR